MNDNWKILSSRSIFSAKPWVSLSADTVRLSNGCIIEDYYHIDLPDFVVIFAETEEQDVLTIRQYKHGARRVSLTLPGGMIEEDEDPKTAAKRELLEETGYEARCWTSLGCYTVNGNQGCGTGHFFKASGAHRTRNPNSDDLEEMQLLLLHHDQLKTALKDGRIVLLNHIAAVLLALNN